jgi:hypothetical protein
MYIYSELPFLIPLLLSLALDPQFRGPSYEIQYKSLPR